MSYNYADYHHRQYDLPQPGQPYQQPRNYANGADPYAQPHDSTARYLFQFDHYDMPYNQPECQSPFQPNAYQPEGHQQRHPYHARQPTCWDPPWLHQTTAYQQPPSYEPEMYSPPLPRRRPTGWDPPAYQETPGQRPFHEVSAYDQPLPPDPNSSWNQPAPWQPHLATTAANPIQAMINQLLEACNRMEARLDATDRRIDNLNIDVVYGSLKSMNKFTPEEVAATCPLNFDLVMLEDNKGNDGGDQPMESGEYAPNVSVEEKLKSATTRQIGKLYAEEDALLAYGEDDGFLKTLSLSPLPQHKALECIQIGLDSCQQISNDDGVTASVDCISKWSRSTGGEGRCIRGLGFNQSQVVNVPIMIRFGVGEYNWTKRSCTFDPGGDISTKLRFESLFIVLWIPP